MKVEIGWVQFDSKNNRYEVVGRNLTSNSNKGIIRKCVILDYDIDFKLCKSYVDRTIKYSVFYKDEKLYAKPYKPWQNFENFYNEEHDNYSHLKL